MNNYGFKTEANKVQEKINGNWYDVAYITTISSYNLYLSKYRDNPNYRVIDGNGNEILPPEKRK